MKIKTYIINLKESITRREYVLGEVAKFPFMDVELIEAVNGREVTEPFNRKRFQDRMRCRLPLPGEVGCTLSHLKCYQHLIDSGEDMALILEDDVSILYPDDMERFVNEAKNYCNSKKAVVVISVPNCLYYSKGKPLFNLYSIHPVVYAKSTCGYLINRSAAKRMLRWKQPFVVADDYVFMKANGIQVFEIYPNIMQGLSDSQVGEFSSIIGTGRNTELGNSTKRCLLINILRKIYWKYIRCGVKMSRIRGEGVFDYCEKLKK